MNTSIVGMPFTNYPVTNAIFQQALLSLTIMRLAIFHPLEPYPHTNVIVI